MPISASEKLRRLQSQFAGEDQVLILINADPDAIASAIALKRLLWRKVAGVTIAHTNVITRPDNLTMIRLLGVSLVFIEEIDFARFTRLALVDSQPNHHPAFAELTFQVIIDHHPDTGIKAPFVDIRPRYGATATMMTEYLKAAKIKPSAKLATALYYAIKTDTDDFRRQAAIEDVRAFQYLFRHANIHMARKIEQSDLKLEFLKYFKRAFNQMRIRKGRVFVHLGAVSNPDVCVLVADFFMRVASVGWSIVSGTYDKKLIIVFRNDGIRKNAGKVAKKSFGALGSAGGHKNMARAELALDDLQAEVNRQDERKLFEWIIKKIEKRTVS
jgi:nanoRNase/pAp phosphatase (c-di-AMP/oligoRNAs hydrolase)